MGYGKGILLLETDQQAQQFVNNYETTSLTGTRFTYRIDGRSACVGAGLRQGHPGDRAARRRQWRR